MRIRKHKTNAKAVNNVKQATKFSTIFCTCNFSFSTRYEPKAFQLQAKGVSFFLSMQSTQSEKASEIILLEPCDDLLPLENCFLAPPVPTIRVRDAIKNVRPKFSDTFYSIYSLVLVETLYLFVFCREGESNEE